MWVLWSDCGAIVEWSLVISGEFCRNVLDVPLGLGGILLMFWVPCIWWHGHLARAVEDNPHLTMSRPCKDASMNTFDKDCDVYSLSAAWQAQQTRTNYTKLEGKTKRNTAMAKEDWHELHDNDLTHSRNQEKGGFIGVVCKNVRLSWCGALSAKTHCWANILGYSLFPWPWHWTLQ